MYLCLIDIFTYLVNRKSQYCLNLYGNIFKPFIKNDMIKTNLLKGFIILLQVVNVNNFMPISIRMHHISAWNVNLIKKICIMNQTNLTFDMDAFNKNVIMKLTPFHLGKYNHHKNVSICKYACFVNQGQLLHLCTLYPVLYPNKRTLAAGGKNKNCLLTWGSNDE